MKYEEALKLEKDCSILLADRRFGLVIGVRPDEMLVQVPGEENVRHIPLERIENLGDGALLEWGGESGDP